MAKRKRGNHKAKEEYRRYLQSAHWRERRLVELERTGHRCEHCAATKELHVHHLTYEHKGNERPGELLVLCKPCHEHVHKRRKSRAPKHLEPRVEHTNVAERQMKESADKRRKELASQYEPLLRREIGRMHAGQRFQAAKICAKHRLYRPSVEICLSVALQELVLREGGKWRVR